MFGAAAMSLSSVCVVTNALRLRNFKETEKKNRKEKEAENAGQLEDRKEEAEAEQTEALDNKFKEEKKMTKTLIVEGMSCGHCTARVQKALEALDGVSVVEMSLEEKSAVVTLDKDIPDETLKDAVEKADYEVVEVR